jgi:phosphoribosylformylglycinamidine synthase
MPWELDLCHPWRLATPLQIMLEGPLGGASFNNEFGRPNIGGYFRTLEVAADTDARATRRGYHKPIMLAGGLGNIRGEHVAKNPIEVDALIVVLGGPAMLIGFGGGACFQCRFRETATEALDFASVQRGNAEMQRRLPGGDRSLYRTRTKQPNRVIARCRGRGSFQCVAGTGARCGLGAVFELDAIPSDEPGLSPMQLWCNEAQERYVLAIAPDRIQEFKALCARERCLFSIVGTTTATAHLRLANGAAKTDIVRSSGDQVDPVDLPMATLFGNTPRMQRQAQRRSTGYPPLDLSKIHIDEAFERVLRLPAVADKTFLITIGDRSVGGQIVRDQMVGPWQVPVADAGVTVAGFDAFCGEAIAVGERTPLALVNAPASGRMAVAEAITNIVCTGIADLSDVHLSANWMAAAGEPGEDAALFDTVRTVATELCPALGICIPVGKDSMSMSTRWTEDGVEQSVSSPLSLIITAFAPVGDVRKCVTPQLNMDRASRLLLVDLARGQQRLGASALAQVYGQVGDETPDLEYPQDLVAFFRVTRNCWPRTCCWRTTIGPMGGWL